MSKFALQGYEYIPGLLDDQEAVQLERELDSIFYEMPMEYDPGRGLIKMVYKPPCAQTIHDRVQYFLTRWLRTDLLPTYWFCTQYYNKSYMAAHKDRDACEISVSLNIQQTEPWQLRLRDRFGKKRAFVTPPGDGVLYAGCDIEHWRTPYKGHRYTQLFLHYVKANGTRTEQQGDAFNSDC